MGNDFYSLARAADHLAAAFIHILTFNGKDNRDVVHSINKVYDVCRNVIEENGHIMLTDDVWDVICVVETIEGEYEWFSNDVATTEHFVLKCLSDTLNLLYDCLKRKRDGYLAELERKEDADE